MSSTHTKTEDETQQSTSTDEGLAPIPTFKDVDPANKDTERELDDVEFEEDDDEGVSSPLKRLGLSGTALRVANWVAVAVLIWLLVTAVSVIGDGFNATVGDQAEELFAFATNPIVGLMIGLLATALIQSSSTVTSIVVGLVAGGLPMGIAIPMLMGANMGTTLTSSLVSLGMVRDKMSFQRAYGAASVHDMYNLLAVFIFFPLEYFFGILERTSGWASEAVAGTDGGILPAIFSAIGNAVSFVTDPLADLIGGLTDIVPEPWGGIALIVIGIALILVSINLIGTLLKAILVGPAKKTLRKAIGAGPISGIVSGTLVTAMVQSSTTTTSLLVPLAGAGTLKIKQVYPFTVGANIGTTTTAIIAAFAFSGVEGQAAMQAAFVHLFFNLFAALLIFVLPFLRPVPPKAASILAYYGAKNKIYVVVWVVGVFLLLPGLLIFLSVVL